MKKRTLAFCLALVAGGASAQVFRCIENGKVVYSDKYCATEKTQRTDIMLDQATMERNRAQAAAAGPNSTLQSIERARRIQRSTVDTVTRQSQSDDEGPAVIGHNPNERIDAQSERNMQRRQAELDASARMRQEQDDRRARAPAQLVNCDGAGCWDTQGNRYNAAAGGNFHRSDGKFCTRAGPNVVCN